MPPNAGPNAGPTSDASKPMVSARFSRQPRKSLCVWTSAVQKPKVFTLFKIKNQRVHVLRARMLQKQTVCKTKTRASVCLDFWCPTTHGFSMFSEEKTKESMFLELWCCNTYSFFKVLHKKTTDLTFCYLWCFKSFCAPDAPKPMFFQFRATQTKESIFLNQTHPKTNRKRTEC